MAARDEIVVRAAAALTTAFVATDSIDIREPDYVGADFAVNIATAGSLSAVAVRVEYALQANPTQWITLQTEDVTAGVSTLSPYEIQVSSPSDGDVIVFSVPDRGQHMRLQIKGTGVSGSSVSAGAYRRR